MTSTSVRATREEGLVAAVGVGGGEVFVLGEEGPVGVVVEEGADDGLVFFGFDAAGGVDEASAGEELPGGGVENSRLDAGEILEVFGLDAPTGFGTLAEDAGVGARDVEKDGVEIFLDVGDAVDASDFDGGEAETADIFGDGSESFLGDFGGKESSLIAEEFGEVCGLTSGSSTDVPEPSAGLGSEEERGALRGFVLNGDDARFPAGEARGRNGFREANSMGSFGG